MMPSCRHRRLGALVICLLVIIGHQLVGERRGLRQWLSSFVVQKDLILDLEDPFSFRKEDLDVFEKNDCFVVQDICIAGHHWFYVNNNKQDKEESSSRTNLYQPNFILEADFNPALGLPHEIFVNESSSSRQPIKHCKKSNIPNHIIVTGQFVDMAMEVYVRLVSGLWEIWNDLSTPWWKSNNPPNSPHVQLYIQVQGESNRTQLIPSMYPMMAGFSRHPVLNVLGIFDGAGCKCYSRLIFCGYYDANFAERIIVKKRRKKREKKMEQLRQQQQQQSTAQEELQRLQKLQQEEQKKQVFLKNRRLKPGYQVGRNKGEDVDPPIRWDLIRNFTRQGAFNTYSNLAERIVDHKRSILRKAFASAKTTIAISNKDIWIQEQSTNRLREWTLIGFSQRRTRRRWLNVPAILQKCLDEWFVPFKIICVEVNLDSDQGRHPENQVIMHAGLDALIGVHGSQQVHVVWMPDGALVLELLPHLMGSWGQWTQTTNRRTPNGKMINHTKLSHVGYPLDESSIPDCEGSLTLRECNNEKRWDDRDIWVHPRIVESFVKKFLVLSPINDASEATAPKQAHRTVTSPPVRSCQDFANLAHDEFVLYHVYCWEDGKPQYRHYFRDRDSFAHLSRSPQG